MNLKNLFIILLYIITSSKLLIAQTATNQVEMADTIRQNGKIYVVVIALSLIMLILLFYIWRTDKKITLLEKKVNKA